MKQKTLWMCEVCGTEYNERIKADKCENNHKKKLKIVGKRYLSITQDRSGMPETITVQDENGNTAVYKR